MSVNSEFDTYSSKVYLNGCGVHTFGECVCEVVVCTYLDEYDYFLGYFVLQL